MDVSYMKKIEEKYVKRTPDVRTGDTVKVHLKIIEAGKERTQIYEGVVIAVKGTGLGRTITVRKISHGVGVEKVLPINSPLVKKIDITNRGDVRRSKLYYMRHKIGKRSLDAGGVEGFEAIMEEDESAKKPAAEAESAEKEAAKEDLEKGPASSSNSGTKEEESKPVEKKPEAKKA